MSNASPSHRPPSSGPPWNIIDLPSAPVVAFDSADVERGRELLAGLEGLLLTAAGFIRISDRDNAANAVQEARSRLARWGGELSALKDRLAERAAASTSTLETTAASGFIHECDRGCGELFDRPDVWHCPVCDHHSAGAEVECAGCHHPRAG